MPIKQPLEEIRVQAEAELSSLTAAEVDVLVMLAQGLCSKQIAHQLGKAQKTVEMQRHTLTKRLGMTYVEAAVLAAKAGWV